MGDVTAAANPMPAVSRDTSLDFIRGIAILLAMGSHFNGSPRAEETWLEAAILWPGRSIGGAGVDLFFVLSGYLVGGLILKEWYQYHSFDSRRFLVRRAFKIWPVLYLFILLQLIANLRPWDTYFFQTLFHVQNYIETPLDHLWSLAVEEHFYLLFAICFAWFTSIQLNTRLLPWILVSIILIEPVIRAVGHSHGATLRDIQWETHYRLDGLAAGVLLAYLNTFSPQIFKKLATPKAAYLLVVLAAGALLAQGEPDGWYRAWGRYSVSIIGGMAMLLLCVNNPLITARFFIVRVLSIIGIYSYSMYVFHNGAARIVTAAWGRLGLPEYPALLITSKYLSAILIAVAIAKLVEIPMLRLRNRMFPGKSPAVNPGATT